MKRLVLGVLVALVCCSASATTLGTYRKMEQTADLARSQSSVQNFMVLTALRSAIAGTIDSLRSRDGSIQLDGKRIICAPSSVQISYAIVRAAIDTAAQEQDKNGQHAFADKLDVATVALRGLVLMYPCAAASKSTDSGR